MCYNTVAAVPSYGSRGGYRHEYGSPPRSSGHGSVCGSVGHCRCGVAQPLAETLWDGIWHRRASRARQHGVGASCTNCHTWEARETGRRPAEVLGQLRPADRGQLYDFVSKNMPNGAVQAAGRCRLRPMPIWWRYPAGERRSCRHDGTGAAEVASIAIVSKDGPTELRPARWSDSSDAWPRAALVGPSPTRRLRAHRQDGHHAHDATRPLGDRSVDLSFVMVSPGCQYRQTDVRDRLP